jgi:uncharacterized repeat protein (TIGR02543 family)
VADRPGYTFLGWGLDPFGTTADHAAGADKTYTTQAFTAYYALWQATDLTITLDPNGGKFGESTESVDKTGTIGQQLLYTIPAKTGYAFVGWAETADASEGNMFPTYTVALNGKTLYAVWKANTVSTAFFAMGGSGNAVLTGNIGSKAAVPADPERTGYTLSAGSQSRTAPEPSWMQPPERTLPLPLTLRQHTTPTGRRTPTPSR